jgi:hypothetical protein
MYFKLPEVEVRSHVLEMLILLKISYLLGCNTKASEEPIPPKCQLAFSGLHGDISQKIKLFITTTVRTSNLT